MKELTIEEKAKAYDEAIEYAYYLISERCKEGTEGSFHRSDLQKMFPTLAESEDERIRKNLIELFHDTVSNDEIFSDYGLDKTKVLAWLEKQVVQKEIDYNEELKKCKDNPLYFFDKYVKVKFKEHKHNWSEDDEKMMQYVIGSIDTNISDSNFKNIRIWFESLKDRVQLQPKQEWSEEDEYNRNIILYCLNNESVGQTDYENAINWLKSLNPQNNVTDKELIQAKKEAYNDALNKIEYHSGEPTFDDGWSAAIWYLKKRNARPQTTWQPTNEQLEALDSATENCAYSEYQDCLRELIQQLKKLREE